MKYGIICGRQDPTYVGSEFIGMATTGSTVIQPYVDDSLETEALTQKWDRERVLEYINEVATAPDTMSDGDQAMLG